MIKSFRRVNIHLKNDERVLGDSDFVERVLEIFQPGKQPVKVKARSFFCCWAVRELGFTMADLVPMAPKLNISQPAVSMSVQRGELTASENGYSLMDE